MRERVGHEENEEQRGRVGKEAGEDIQGVALTRSHPSPLLAHTHLNPLIETPVLFLPSGPLTMQ